MTSSATGGRVAVVEDDRIVRDTVVDILQEGGFSALACDSAGALAKLMGDVNPPELIILDLQLPDRDGLAVAGSIRSSSDIPIIMLTGRGSDVDRIVGLEIGADDYMVKPFNPRELLARVKAVLRRKAPGQISAVSAEVQRRGYRFLGFSLDLDGRRLTDPAGEPVSLTVSEFDLLAALVEARGRVLSRNQLLDLMRRRNDDVFDRTVDVLILRLRRKIEPSPRNPCFIRTERGLGYVFDAPVEPLAVS
ncbi:response regulator transcription factor [Rhizobiales bacterium]|uniref:winged helix-turn-helix domain-containing protein n=1 Tax=Hongsoonwoonella zoysiae TaxID=2821844 RepID=UPI00155F99E0|nr:response regulator transcription factor [Hongsoonwoonella zoysiae]NRG16602.1 response regulator transcription factor [Hongsoonwoonella zoysiae]